jgi:SAM-dependent methyltransferase
MDPFSWFLFLLVVIASSHYVYQVICSKMGKDSKSVVKLDTEEGFENIEENIRTTKEGEWFNNETLYDDFYASVYDQLVQGAARTQGEVALCMTAWKSDGTLPSNMAVLDAGCGTGLGCIALAKMDVEKVIGVDNSPAMLKRAQEVNVPKSLLSPKQKQAISFRETDLLNPSALGGGEVSHAMMLYFSIYYVKDIEALFRNLYLWVKPGGRIAIEVVNKHKFDPMLESAAPWLAFSLQKYSKERVTKSDVTFNKFTYSANFELDDPSAEFRETFRFKDGRIRRQKHEFRMPDISDIVKTAQIVGWKYTQYIDLTSIGFEYAYLLLFRHP